MVMLDKMLDIKGEGMTDVFRNDPVAHTKVVDLVTHGAIHRATLLMWLEGLKEVGYMLKGF